MNILHNKTRQFTKLVIPDIHNLELLVHTQHLRDHSSSRLCDSIGLHVKHYFYPQYSSSDPRATFHYKEDIPKSPISSDNKSQR
jgi:hypothetical protein